MNHRDIVAAKRAVEFPGDVVMVGLREGPVAVTVELDELHHDDRLGSGLDPITDRGLLTALWELPFEIETAASALPDWARRRIDAEAGNAVRRTDTGYIRVVRAPLRITGALVVGRSLNQLLARVGQLSAIAPMAAAMTRVVDVDSAAVLDAALYGIGVVQLRGESTSVLTSPQAVQPCIGPFPWWVTELAYERIVNDPGAVAPKH